MLKNPGRASNIVNFFLLLALVGISYVVAVRDFSVGNDTYNYATYFYTQNWMEGGGRYEWLFAGLTKAIRSITGSVEFYFFAISITICLSYYWFYRLISKDSLPPKSLIDRIFLVGLLLGSSWFLVAVTNGLRQGMSLPFMYLSIYFIRNNKYISSIVCLVIASGLHTSSLLIVPFFFALFIPRKALIASVAVSALLYLLGGTEKLVRISSSILGLGIYDHIKEYGQDSGNWIGFQIDLFIYSTFWPVAFYGCSRFISKKFREGYLKCADIYSILILPYFWFGFGGYSNRYGFIAWFTIPAILAVAITASRLTLAAKAIIVSLACIYGAIFFSSKFISLGM